MIDETKTLELFGYTSDKLSKGSGKKICRICDICGDEKFVIKNRYMNSKYPNLCRSCSAKQKYIDDPTLRECWSSIMKQSYIDDPTIRERQSEAAKQAIINDTTLRTRRGAAIKQAYIDNPVLRERRSCEMKQKYIDDPTLRECWSSIMKQSYIDDPTIRERQSTTHKQRFINDPTLREQRSAMGQGIPYNEWCGFLTDQKYCPKFNESLKTQIRNQYNNCDYMSGLHKLMCNKNRNLDVHHVDYNKQQGCEDHQWKLIPLSRVNHMRTNTNRFFWNRLFTYSLQYEAEYYGDE